MKLIKTLLAALLPQSAVMHLKALDHYMNGEPELRLLKGLVDSKRQAIDAGANIGTYSYYLRRYASCVHAYEPNPELAARLRAVLPDVKVRQVALSDKPAELTFSVPIDLEGRPSHELGSVAQTFSGLVQRFPVQCITIDSESLNDIGFIKIDVEQHEREVLRGGMETIDRCRPVILIEVYPLKYQRPIAQEFSFILNRNYCAWFSFAGRWIALEEFDASIHAAPEKFGKNAEFMGNNLILFPKEHPRANFGPQRRS